MKKLTFSVLFAFILLFTGCNSSSKKITLTGEIEGLQPGDTLVLKEMILPKWINGVSDTFFVAQPNKLTFEKKIPHTTFFILSYLPKDTLPLPLASRGTGFVVPPGHTIFLTGTTDYMATLDRRGGFYEDSLVYRLNALENEYDMPLTDIYRKIEQYNNGVNPDSLNKYADLYSNRLRPTDMIDVRNYIKDEINDNEYAAYLYLTNLYNVNYSQLKERYEKFTPEIKKSYMGQRLESMMGIFKNIEVGNKPTDFTVIDAEDNEIRLSDYQGKYVLIYHWGMCPGTFWVNPKIIELYEKYHDKGFEVLGFTADDYLEELYRTSSNEELKNMIDPLLNPVWRTTIYTTEHGNDFIVDDYYFSGVPILMFISPDGTTLARGFSDVYEPMKKILEENLED